MADSLITSQPGNEQVASPVTTPTPTPEATPTPAEGTPPAEGSPEAKPEAAPFDATKWTAPEGLEVDAAAMGKFGEIAKAQGLTQGQGEALLGLWNDLQAEASTKQASAWNELQTNWRNEISADPTFGGAKLTVEVLPTISKAIDQFGVPGVREAFDLTGAGNNPAVIKFVYQMAKAITEGGPIQGKPVASQPPQSAADIMYAEKK